MKDFKSTQGGVSGGTDFQAVEGPASQSCCTDNSPKGEQADKGPGTGTGAGGTKLH